MNGPEIGVPDIEGRLHAELGLVTDAIRMVASGYSTRVVVAGLTFGESLIAPARRTAAEHGVSIQPQWTADETGASVAVVRMGVAG
jgi:hypothetical protein